MMDRCLGVVCIVYLVAGQKSFLSRENVEGVNSAVVSFFFAPVVCDVSREEGLDSQETVGSINFKLREHGVFQERGNAGDEVAHFSLDFEAWFDGIRVVTHQGDEIW